MTKQPPGMTMLTMRVREGEVSAAREYLKGFGHGAVADRDVLLQALTVLIMDLDAAGQA